jgi:3'-5' exoribonuclease
MSTKTPSEQDENSSSAPLSAPEPEAGTTQSESQETNAQEVNVQESPQEPNSKDSNPEAKAKTRPVIEKSSFIADLPDTGRIEGTFLLKHMSLSSDRNGKPYLNIVMGDKTGTLEGRAWAQAQELSNRASKNDIAQVSGKLQRYQGRKQLVVEEVRKLDSKSADMEPFIPKTSFNVEDMFNRLEEWVESFREPTLKLILQTILKDTRVKEGLFQAPAAKTVHHAFRGGLLEHVLSMLELSDRICEHYQKLYPELNRDMVLSGLILHDLAKIWELEYDRSFDYTDMGRLVGHLVLGSELVEKVARDLEAQGESLDGEQVLLLKHVILSHHGELEYGSPKRPATVEALLVHHMDRLDSKIGGAVQFIADDRSPGKWTQLNRIENQFFWKGEKGFSKPQKGSRFWGSKAPRPFEKKEKKASGKKTPGKNKPQKSATDKKSRGPKPPKNSKPTSSKPYVERGGSTLGDVFPSNLKSQVADQNHLDQNHSGKDFSKGKESKSE